MVLVGEILVDVNPVGAVSVQYIPPEVPVPGVVFGGSPIGQQPLLLQTYVPGPQVPVLLHVVGLMVQSPSAQVHVCVQPQGW